jgi:predicted amidophosphoribosyltransferase
MMAQATQPLLLSRRSFGPRSAAGGAGVVLLRQTHVSPRRHRHRFLVLSQPLRTLSVVLLPVTCPGCGREEGVAPCVGCAEGLRAPPVLAPPVGLDGCASLFVYEGAGRELVARLKYRNARAALRPLADALVALVDGAHVDVVTWPPTTAARRRGRGFDQSALLARAVARRLGRPCRRLLRRRPGPPQTGRPAVARRQGPVFLPARPGTGSVLLVDDVRTTGATLVAAARALREAGARHVWAVTLAQTPERS